MSHEPLLTSVVGSHARPGWFVSGIAAAERGEFGPADLDGDARRRGRPGDPRPGGGRHRRRQRRRDATGRLLHGRVLPPPDRRRGAARRPPARRRARTTSSTASPFASRSPRRTASAWSREFAAARARTERPLKVTLPGPVHAVRPAGLRPGRGLRDARSRRPRRSCRSCGRSSRAWSPPAPTFIQIDEPSPAIHPEAPADFAALFNAAVAPVVGRVRLGAHLCFGNYLGRPLAPRTYRPVLDAMLGFDVDELVLEFANREMAEVGILARDRRRRPRRRRGRHRRQELVRRDRRTRSPSGSRRSSRPVFPPSASPSCRTAVSARRARHFAVAKLAALVAGRDLVRRGMAAPREA